MQQYVAEIKKSNATLFAISPELHEYSRKMKATRRLTFDLLWDQRNSVAHKFGLTFSLSDQMIETYRDSFNVNLKLYHGDNDWTLPIPARYVIDSSGKIVYGESSIDPAQRPDPDELMDVLRSVSPA